MKHSAFIGLGSNLANPSEQVLQAMQAIGRLPDTRLIAHSSLYRSAPVGYLEQPDFINAVVRIETALAPVALLQALLALERHCQLQESLNFQIFVGSRLNQGCMHRRLLLKRYFYA